MHRTLNSIKQKWKLIIDLLMFIKLTRMLPLLSKIKVYYIVSKLFIIGKIDDNRQNERVIP
jgi:hypothetical protein